MRRQMPPGYSISLDPGKNKIRHLMACCLDIAITTIIQTNMYAFKRQDYIQSEGGPISLKFTGALARIFMPHWAQTCLGIVKKICLKIELGDNYVDNLRFMTEYLKPGSISDQDSKNLVVSESQFA